MSDGPQGVDGLLRVLGESGDVSGNVVGPFPLGDGLGDTELDFEGDDLLLSSVVEVSFQPVPFGILGGDEAQA